MTPGRHNDDLLMPPLPVAPWFIAISLIAALACGPGEPGGTDLPPNSPPSAILPDLERIEFQYGLDTLPWAAGPLIAVTISGQVAISGLFAEAPWSDYTVHVFDAPAESLISVSRLGEGPGETGGSGLLAAHGDTLPFSSRNVVRFWNTPGTGPGLVNIA